MRTGVCIAVHADTANADSREEERALTLNLAVSMIVLLCGMSIVSLLASIAVCIKAQELHTQSMELFGLVYDWIEQSKDKEAEHEAD